jgi:dTDP-4-dehydrorhamnose reductase
MGSSVDVVAATHEQLAVEDQSAVTNFFDEVGPHVVIHAAAYTAVDDCERSPDRAFAVNALGTRHVAKAAEKIGAYMLYVSTDYVFDGEATRPYRETDPTNPISVYGASKLAGEHECSDQHAVVRTSWLCGVHGSNFVRTVLRLAGSPDLLRFVDDQRGCPTFTADLADVLVGLALDRVPGCFHATNQGEATWFEFARAVLEYGGHDPSRVLPITTAQLDPPRAAARPKYSVLDNAALREAGWDFMAPWQDGLERMIRALQRSAQ